MTIKKVIDERQLSLLGHAHRVNEERLTREIFEVRAGEKQGRKTAKKIERTSQTNSRAERNKLERGRNVDPEQRSMEEKN